jgi:hypothetical protein
MDRKDKIDLATELLGKCMNAGYSWKSDKTIEEHSSFCNLTYSLSQSVAERNSVGLSVPNVLERMAEDLENIADYDLWIEDMGRFNRFVEFLVEDMNGYESKLIKELEDHSKKRKYKKDQDRPTDEIRKELVPV